MRPSEADVHPGGVRGCVWGVGWPSPTDRRPPTALLALRRAELLSISGAVPAYPAIWDSTWLLFGDR